MEAFYERVWEVVRHIPPGRVSSYGAIARYLGSSRSARLVGYAMNASHAAPEYVPAHRVVNRLGMLSGKHHFPEPEAMQGLLEKEGVRVENDQVQAFAQLFWDPSEALDLNYEHR